MKKSLIAGLLVLMLFVTNVSVFAASGKGDVLRDMKKLQDNTCITVMGNYGKCAGDLDRLRDQDFLKKQDYLRIQNKLHRQDGSSLI